ncbi:MAG: pyridoxal phosphate-dependent aminotransferase [Dethiobacter sp.]|jgi:aspartate aminotransferase|nr:pyridoxal phosphate-dependent aminotransferase [Dethiobacter sp.]
MFAKKALSISPSPTLAIDALAKKMKSEGVDVVGFGAGEPDFDTPEHIRDAGIRAITDGYTKYTPAAGSLELQQAICKKLKTDNGLDYSPAEIVISNGAKHSLTNIFAAILDPGDEVIVPAPYWVSYPEMVKLNDGVPVVLPTRAENRFKATVKELTSALTVKTKAVVLNSPSNPTGQVYSGEELQAVARFAVENNLFVVSDEIYEKLIYGEIRHISIASLGEEIKKMTIVVNGVSKTYAMTGWRIGYTACDAGLAKIMGNIQSHATSNPNSMAQKAALAALEGSQECVQTMREAFAARRDFMVKRIGDLAGLYCIEPEGAFYVLLGVNKTFGRSYRGTVLKNCDDFASALLENSQVAVVPGSGFGAPDFVRLSYAVSMEHISKGLDRIETFVKELR